MKSLKKVEDFRAKRITSYLNLVNKLAEKKFEEIKEITTKKSHEIKKYFSMLPDSSEFKKEFQQLTEKHFPLKEIRKWVADKLSMGSIDVNIMTKIDKTNYQKGEKLPTEFNDAHAALRGYANSDLASSVVFSAGMNPRLYSYVEQFDDFYPDQNGNIKKKIILKVSDYRSAFIQGKFLAKKGLWVSEYRIESGLNCGGHAFATDGYLLGPVLAEFRDKRKELIQSVHEICVEALSQKNRFIPSRPLPLKITAQGGVGTAEEHQFLIEHYELDSVGWGSPFLLVPEATTVDNKTIQKLMNAGEKDLYLSNISPLGVPFNNLKGNSKDLEKTSLIVKGRPGSSCPKKYVALNNEFSDKNLCIASREYQYLKLKELEKENLSFEERNQKYSQIVEKSCICVGLGTSALLVNELDTKREGEGVSVCPGPNMAYFSSQMSLQEITDHIYGRGDVVGEISRPNMFVKELGIYIDFLKNKLDEYKDSANRKQQKYLKTFAKNLEEGIGYYDRLIREFKDKFRDQKLAILSDLENNMKVLLNLNKEIEGLASKD